MIKRKIGQVDSKSAVNIQVVKKQKNIGMFLCFKLSKRCGHETLIQSNSESSKEALVHSNTASICSLLKLVIKGTMLKEIEVFRISW